MKKEEGKEKPIIKLENVWKIYHVGDSQVNALDNINLEIYQGEFVAIQGPSGSGKSTAMNMVGCLDVPTKGKIFLEGKDISELTESELAQLRGQKIGFVFQQFNLINTLSAIENIALPMTFQGKTIEERTKQAKKILASLDLKERGEHKPNELSGGQQQRIAIARALANDPDIVLADEPTGNLDSKTGKYIMDLLIRLNKEKNKTIIMVTHDNQLSKYAQKIFYLKDGKITNIKINKKSINNIKQKIDK